MVRCIKTEVCSLNANLQNLNNETKNILKLNYICLLICNFTNLFFYFTSVQNQKLETCLVKWQKHKTLAIQLLFIYYIPYF